jgi:hypothetical protein
MLSLQGFIETAVGTNRNAVNGLNALVTAGGAFLHATNDSPANAAATTIVIIADSNGALGAL